jgi:hypothetical protein
MSVLLLAALPLVAQPDPNLLVRHTFEKDAEGWVVMGPGGAVHAAAGSLVFSYELRPKQFSMAVLPAPPETARMQRLRLRVKADRDMPVAVLLSERKPGGGNYTAIFWAPANTWQAVELAPGDFILSDGPNDPRDSNGKLDLDSVEGIGIADHDGRERPALWVTNTWDAVGFTFQSGLVQTQALNSTEAPSCP